MRILASPAFSNEKVNPYNAMLYREIANDGAEVIEYSHAKNLLQRFNILHFHWPDGYINQKSFIKALQRAATLFFFVLLAKLKGSKIVWTAHNVSPHDAHHPKFAKSFIRWFIKRCNGLIFLSEENKNAFIQNYKISANSACAIIPHGHYRNAYHSPIPHNDAKASLNLPANKKVLLFIGMIKRYKNVNELIQLFKAGHFTDHILVIAGNPDTDTLRNELFALAEQEPAIHLLLKFIPNEDVHIYLSAADIVILPYKNILNSGALLLALSFNKPVIAPHRGSVISLQKELGEDWIYTYKDELNQASFTGAIQALSTNHRSAVCPLEKYDWDQLGNATVNFYKSLLT